MKSLKLVGSLGLACKRSSIHGSFDEYSIIIAWGLCQHAQAGDQLSSILTLAFPDSIPSWSLACFSVDASCPLRVLPRVPPLLTWELHSCPRCR